MWRESRIMDKKYSGIVCIFILLYLATDHGVICSRSHEGKFFLFNSVPVSYKPTFVNYFIIVLSADVYDGEVTYFWYDCQQPHGQSVWASREAYTKTLTSGSFLRFHHHASNSQVTSTSLIEGAIGVESTVFISVVMSNSHEKVRSAAALLAVPVDIWDTEYVLVTPDTPFFIVTTIVDNKIRIKFSILDAYGDQTLNVTGDSQEFLLQPENQTITHGTEIIKELREYTSLRLIVYRRNFTFTGTQVIAQHPVGVVCGGYGPYFRKARTSRDMTHDHILPVKYGAGRIFLICDAPKICRNGKLDYLQAVSLEQGQTDILEVDGMQGGQPRRTKIGSIEHQHGRFYWSTRVITPCIYELDIYYDGMLTRIESTKDIQMAQYRPGVVKTVDIGFNNDAGSILLIPVSMYRSYYIVTSVPNVVDRQFRHNHVIILGENSIQVEAEPDIFTTYSKKVISEYDSDRNIHVIQSPIGQNDTRTLIRGQNCSNRFFLFVAGATTVRGYMYPGGFSVYELKSDNCVKTNPVSGDHVDNDCDGKADEVSDADDDGKNAQGMWSTWVPIPEDEDPCNKMDCMRERTRSCTNPRPGLMGQKCAGQNDTSEEVSYEEIPGCKTAKCIPKCAPYTYGSSCWPCAAGCLDCDRKTGDCYRCAFGYILVHETCEEVQIPERPTPRHQTNKSDTGTTGRAGDRPTNATSPRPRPCYEWCAGVCQPKTLKCQLAEPKIIPRWVVAFPPVFLLLVLLTSCLFCLVRQPSSHEMSVSDESSQPPQCASPEPEESSLYSGSSDGLSIVSYSSSQLVTQSEV